MAKKDQKRFIIALSIGLALGILFLIGITFALFKFIELFGQSRGTTYWFILLFIIWRISKAIGKRNKT